MLYFCAIFERACSPCGVSPFIARFFRADYSEVKCAVWFRWCCCWLWGSGYGGKFFGMGCKGLVFIGNNLVLCRFTIKILIH